MQWIHIFRFSYWLDIHPFPFSHTALIVAWAIAGLLAALWITLQILRQRTVRDPYLRKFFAEVARPVMGLLVSWIMYIFFRMEDAAVLGMRLVPLVLFLFWGGWIVMRTLRFIRSYELSKEEYARKRTRERYLPKSRS